MRVKTRTKLQPLNERKRMARHLQRERRWTKANLKKTRGWLSRMAFLQIHRVFWVNPYFNKLWRQERQSNVFNKRSGYYGFEPDLKYRAQRKSRQRPLTLALMKCADVVQPVLLAREQEHP